MSTPSLIVVITIAIIIGIATLIAMRGHSMPRDAPHSARAASSFITGVVVVAASLILLVLLSAAYTTYAIQSSQQKWCDTLSLITAHAVPMPADAAANPSREQAYRLYTDFIALKARFGCS